MGYNETKKASIDAHRVHTSAPAIVGADDVPANRFVKISGADDQIILSTAATDASTGVTDRGGDIGDMLSVQSNSKHIVETGGTFAAGAFVTSDSTGRAVTGTQANHRGVAKEASTAAGQFVTVDLDA